LVKREYTLAAWFAAATQSLCSVCCLCYIIFVIIYFLV